MADTDTDTDRSAADRARQLETLDRLAGRFGRSLQGAFTANLNAGRQLDGVLGSLTTKLAGVALKAAASPVKAGVASLVRGLLGAASGADDVASATALARGGVIAGGRVRPFAQGGIVAAPTYFPMQGGSLGLMGEAGPEAILPLRRGSDGRLGVAAGGGSPAAAVTVHITTPDLASFRRSEAQVAASLARAVARGRRAL